MRNIRDLSNRPGWFRPALNVSLALVLAGCQNLATLFETSPKPSLRVQGASIKDLSLTSLTLLFDVEVTNPYDVPLPLTNLDYALASRDKPFLSGSAPVQGTIPARQAKVVPVPARLSFAPILGLLEGVKPGAVVPYRADLKLSVDAPVVGPLVLPLSHTGEFPIPTVPSVSLPQVTWKKVSLDGASGTIRLALKNTNSFPLDLKKLAFDFALADTKVGEAGISEPASFKPGDEKTFDIPISISPQRLGLGALQLLKSEGRTFKLVGLMSVGTPFGPLDLPLTGTGTTKLAP